MYWFLSWCGASVSIYEHPAEGGPDFLCESAHGTFLVEVTSLSAAAVAKETGVPADYCEGARSFSPVSRKLYEKTLSKVPQLQAQGRPTVLSITTEHVLGSALMDHWAARRLLTGKDYLTFRVGDPEMRTWVETALEDSVFYNRGYGSPTDHCRRDISAVVLVHITGGSLRAIGALNPGATFPLDPQALSSIPFFAVSQGPDRSNPTIVLKPHRRADPEYVPFPGEVDSSY